jgi:hypothetical protein
LKDQQLHSHIRHFLQLLEKELDGLTHDELLEACCERGLRTDELDEKHLKFQLREWLDLSLRHNVPFFLLVLSRRLEGPVVPFVAQGLKKDAKLRVNTPQKKDQTEEDDILREIMEMEKEGSEKGEELFSKRTTKPNAKKRHTKKEKETESKRIQEQTM